MRGKTLDRAAGREVTLAGQRRRDRRGLLATTALQAGAVLVLAFPGAVPAFAQLPLPTARPTGGTVVAGQASIQQGTATTTVSQASQRAAVDWTSYDIGSQHTVVYQQPNASSITLNRVTGPDPSQIAGKIVANGQVAIVNRSGVVFHAGSEVDVQSLVVSSANVTNANFMAGRMAFDQPGKPDARISNAGTITVKQTGLAALVAPQVANTGVISAKLGHVVLAGGEASTVDLYGDGLMSVDVTRQVTHTPAGQTALVTNSGTVVADGGTIVLTAKAADGIVQNLVNAGGRLRANSVGDKTGTVVVAAIGGSVTIEGSVTAAGRTPGTTGGTVQLAASDTVSVAARARVDASGRAGGGVVAIGTTPARALAQGTAAGMGIPAGTARLVRVAAGAKVKADATENGTGGTIALLATDNTASAGALSARGGRTGGDGGRIEVSSGKTVGLSGTVDTTAPAGKTGMLLLDPNEIDIGGTASSDPSADPQTISATDFNAIASDITLVAGTTLNLVPGGTAALTQSHNVTLLTATGGTITVNTGLSTTGTATLALGAFTNNAAGGYGISSAINVNAPLSSATLLALAASNITVASGLTGNTRVTLQTDTLTLNQGSAVATAGGTVAVAPITPGLALTIDAVKATGNLSLTPTDLAALANPAAPPAQLVLGDVSATPSAATATAGTVTLNAPVDLSAQPVSLGFYASGAIAQTATAPIKLNGAASFTAGAGDQVQLTAANTLPTIGNVSGTQVALAVTGATTVSGTVSATPGGTGNGQVALSGDAAVNVAGTVQSTTNAVFLSGGTVSVSGTVSAPAAAGVVSISATTGLALAAGSTVTAGTRLDLAQASGALTVGAGGLLTVDPAATITAPAVRLGQAALSSGGSSTAATSITFNSALNLGTSTVDLESSGPVSQTAGAGLTAGTLEGNAGSFALTTTNAISALGPITATGNFALVDAQPLTVAASGSVTAQNVAITTVGTGSTLTVDGPIGACATDPTHDGTVALSSADMLTLAATVGGERSTTLSGTAVAMNAGAFVEAGRSGATPIAGAVTISGPTTLNAGATVAANTVSAQAVMQTGGTLAANTLSTGAYGFGGGTVETANSSLTISAGGIGASDLVIGNGVRINATGPAASTFTSAGTVYSANGLTIVLPGSFDQAGGQIAAAGAIRIAGSANGLTAAPGSVTQSGGTLAASGTLELYGLGTGAATVSGSLYGGTVQVLAPGATLSFAPSALGGAPVVTAPGYTLSLFCPGCATTGTPGVTQAGLTVTPGTGAANLRLDGSTLTLPTSFSAGTLELHSLGDTSQTGGAITATLLKGTAGYGATTAGTLPTYDYSPATAGTGGVAIAQGGNAIGSIGPYYALGGISVASPSAPLTVSDQIVAGGNQLVALAAPSLTVDAPIRFGTVSGGAFSASPSAGTFTAAPAGTSAAFDRVVLQADALQLAASVTAPGGAVAIAPLTDIAMSLDAMRASGHLSLTPGDLAEIGVLDPLGGSGPALLQLGNTDISGATPAATTTTAASITVNTSLPLANTAATLGLYATGDVREITGDGVAIGRPAASGNAGTIGTITGAAGGTVALGGLADATPANAFDKLGPFSAGTGLSASDTSNGSSGRNGLTVAGTVSSGSGALSLLDMGSVQLGMRQAGTIAVTGTLDASGQTLTLDAANGGTNAAAITTGPASALRAGTLTGVAQSVSTAGTAYDVMLNGGSNAIASLSGFTVGQTGGGSVTPQGAFTLATATDLAVSGPVTAKSVSLAAADIALNGAVSAITAGVGTGTVALTATGAGGTVAVQSGTVGGETSLTVTAPGGLTVSGGTADAPTVTLTGGTGLSITGGTLFGNTVQVGGTAVQSGGVLHANSLTTGGLAFSGGDLYAGNGLGFAVPAGAALTGQAATPGNLSVTGNGIASTATLVAGGTLGIADSGTFTQSAGTIASVGNLTVAAAGVVDQSGGAMLSGGTLLLRGAGSDASSVTGQLAGATIQVVEPGSALTFAPGVFSGNHALRGAASVASGTLANSFLPGAQSTTLTGVAAAPGASRPAGLRVDGATLTLGSSTVVIAADTVALHSAGATSQAGGSLEASSLSGTAGYAGTSPASPGLPDYSALTPSGTALATVTLNAAANNIAAITGYQVTGDTSSATTTQGLVVADAPGAQTTSNGAVVTPAGLMLSGTVQAGAIAVPLTATAAEAGGKDVAITVTGPAATAGLTVGGTLAGRTVTLAANGAVTEPGGTVVTGTLAASGTSVTLNAANQVATLGPVAASTGGVTFVNARDLLVAGPVSAPGGTVAITAHDGTGTVSVAEGAATGDLTVGPSTGTANVTGLAVALTGTDVMLNGAVGACEVGGAGGSVTVAATGTPPGSAVAAAPGTIVANAGSVTGGQVSLALTAPGGVVVQGGTLNAPVVSFAATTAAPTASPTTPPLLTLTGGQVYGNTVTVNGSAKLTDSPAYPAGGTLAAGTLTVTGTLTFDDGALYAGRAGTGGGPLSITVDRPVLVGTVATGGALAVNGTGVTSTANLFAGGGLTITDGGTFTQAGGTIAGAGVTVAAVLVDQTGGAMESTGTLLLRGTGTGAATVSGSLAGQTIQVIEPGAPLEFAPVAFAAGGPLLGGAATLTTSAVPVLTFTCPGCTPLAANTLTLGTVVTGATPGSLQPGALRVDGGSTLTLGAPGGAGAVIAAGTIELHSAGATAEQPGTGLQASSLSGTAGYLGTSPALPGLPDYSALTPSGVGLATVTLNGPNNVAQITSYRAIGDAGSTAGLTFNDAPTAGLTVTGTVQAGAIGADTLTATAANSRDVTITVNGAGQALQIGTTSAHGATVAGRTVSLAAGGDITEGGTGATNAGSIVAATLDAVAGGSVQLATIGGSGLTANQVAVLANVSAGTGTVTVTNSRNLTVSGPVSAATGVTLTAQNGAGTPAAAEGQAAGNLTLDGPVTTAGGNAVLTAYGTLSGASVTAPGGAVLDAGGDVNVGGITANALSGSAGGNFTASGSFASASANAATGVLTITDGTALLLTGPSSGATGATITAPSLTLSDGLFAGGALRLRATGGDITQTGGTVGATGPLLLTGATDTSPIPGALTQAAGVLASATGVTALVTGDATQLAAGTVAGMTVQVASLDGTNDFGANRAASVTPAHVTVTLGTLPSFSVTAGTAALSAVGSVPLLVRLDGVTVNLVSPVGATTVVLHSAGNTTEMPGGTIAASVLTGTAGYAASGTDAAGLPTYATLDPALPGSGSATLQAGGNAVGRLGDYDARSGFALLDAGSLVVGGTVRSGIATDPLTGAAVDASGAPLAITLTSPGSTLTIGDPAAPSATLAGSTVTLTVPGAISEAPGALVAAGTLTGSAGSASLAPMAGNQVVRLGAFTTGGNFTLTNGTDLSVTGAVLAGPNPPAGTTPVLTLGIAGGLDLNGGSLTAGTVAITASGPFTETNGSIDADSLSIAASQVTAGSGANNVTVLSSAVAPGGIAFTDAGSLVTAGPVQASMGAIALQVGGNLVTQGVVAAAGAVTFGVGGTTTIATGSVVSGASVTGNSVGALAIAGSVTSPGAVDFASNGATLTGSVSAGGPATLAAGTGALTEAAGASLGGATVTTTSGAATSLAGSVTAQGALSVTANGVTLSGTAVVQAGSGTVSAGAGALTQAGLVTTSGDLTETAGGTATLSGTTGVGGAFSLAANGVTFAPGSSTTVQVGPSTIAAGTGALNQAGVFGTGGGLTATAGQSATLAGAVTVLGPLSVVAQGVTLAPGSQVQAGATTVAAGAGAFTAAGTLLASSLAEMAGGPATVTGTVAVNGPTMLMGNEVTLAQTSVVHAGPTVVDAGPGALNEAGTLTTNGNLTETAGGTATLSGSTTVSGALALNANGVTLASGSTLQAGPATVGAGTGAFSQAGTLTVGSLTETAGGPAALAGTVTVNGPMTLTDNGVTVAASSRVVAGATQVAAGSGTLDQAGTVAVTGDLTATATGAATFSGTTTVSGQLALTAGGVTFGAGSSTQAGSGTVQAGSNALRQDGALNVTGALAEEAGTIVQGGTVTAGTTLSETASGTAGIGGTTAAGSSYALTAGSAATLSGTETAPLLTVAAPSITLVGGTIVTGGVAQSHTTPIDNLPEVSTAGAGLFLEAGGAFVQTGQTVVTTTSGAAAATVRVDLTMGTGSILFASLMAPQGNLTLNLGNGTAAGLIDVNTLSVIRSGTSLVSTGSTDLRGIVGGFGGTTAAGVSAISEPGRDYRVNACAISSVNCVVLEPQIVPVRDPLKELVLDFFRDQEGDQDLLLPNVTDQGL